MLGVTLFGIFLTPVFFYVIQGIGETSLFAGAAVQWVSSILLGGLLGAGTGYLISQLGVASVEWAVGIGATAGVLGVLAVRGAHKQLLKMSPQRKQR
jgi:multidrug efflux pump